MNIYLDIDGVILANEKSLAPYAEDFLEYVISKYPDNVYWLTTHCWKGENRAVDVLAPLLRPEVVKLIKKIKSTEWGDLKTDAINFKHPFIWLDDDLLPEEKQVLVNNKAINNFVHIDLAKNPNQLWDYWTHTDFGELIKKYEATHYT